MQPTPTATYALRSPTSAAKVNFFGGLKFKLKTPKRKTKLRGGRYKGTKCNGKKYNKDYVFKKEKIFFWLNSKSRVIADSDENFNNS